MRDRMKRIGKDRGASARYNISCLKVTYKIYLAFACKLPISPLAFGVLSRIRNQYVYKGTLTCETPTCYERSRCGVCFEILHRDIFQNYFPSRERLLLAYRRKWYIRSFNLIRKRTRNFPTKWIGFIYVM